MARKLSKPADDDKVTVQDVDQKDFLDPAVSATLLGATWFAVKAAIQGVIGYIAVKLFEPVWEWWTSKEENESGEGISEEEQEPES